jgi:hypothetical protein
MIINTKLLSLLIRPSKKQMIFSLLFVFLFPTISLQAKPMTEMQARKVVEGWLNMENEPLKAKLGGSVKETVVYNDDTGNPLFYVVYLAPTGFVIVSADDLIEPIIAFLPTGTFDYSQKNPLGALVKSDIPKRVAFLRDKETQAKNSGAAFSPAGKLLEAQAKWEMLGGDHRDGYRESGVALSDLRVSPLLTSKWSQTDCWGLPCYNYYTPNNYPSGCVATAQAQLMRYHAYPTRQLERTLYRISVDGSSQYRSLRGGDGTGGPYNWLDMVMSPDGTTSLAQRQAIGALLHDAGVSVGMSYRPDGSGAFMESSAHALVNSFFYTNAIAAHPADSNYLDSSLETMINTNLDAAHPVLLGITDFIAGHAIVADGYGFNLSTEYHHLNMGWGGYEDAWYNLPNIVTQTYLFNTIKVCTYNVFTSGSGEIISGRVLDKSGYPIYGATVSATRNGGGVYTTSTNSQGIYALAKIPSSSTYLISVTKEGFTFSPPRTVSITRSTENSSTTGNLWGVDFVSPTVLPRFITPLISKLLLNHQYIPPVCPVIPDGDFEKGPTQTDWITYTSAVGYKIISSQYQPHSGSYYIDLFGDKAIAYVRQQMKIPAECPYLTFYHRISPDYRTDCATNKGYVKINGNTVASLDLCGGSGTNGWVKKSVDLKSYAGQTVNVQFELNNTASDYITVWDIDDIIFAPYYSDGGD